MQTKNKSIFSLFTVIGVIFSNNALAEFEFNNYELVNKERVGRSDYNYTFKGTITNSGDDQKNVTAQLTSTSPYIIVNEGELIFGDIKANESLVSTDTFTVKINRRYPFDESALSWAFSADEVSAPILGDVILKTDYQTISSCTPVELTALWSEGEFPAGADNSFNVTFIGNDITIENETLNGLTSETGLIKFNQGTLGTSTVTAIYTDTNGDEHETSIDFTVENK